MLSYKIFRNDKILLGLHVKSPVGMTDFNQMWVFLDSVLLNFLISDFHEMSGDIPAYTYIYADRQTRGI
jgi:hypothetical protein